jgi:hypothetical protein
MFGESRSLFNNYKGSTFLRNSKIIPHIITDNRKKYFSILNNPELKLL